MVTTILLAGLLAVMPVMAQTPAVPDEPAPPAPVGHHVHAGLHAPDAPHPPMAPRAGGFHEGLLGGLMGRLHAAEPTEVQREEIHQRMEVAHEGPMGQKMKAFEESRRDLRRVIFDVNLSDADLRAALQTAAVASEVFVMEAAAVSKSIYNMLDAEQQAAWDAFEPQGLHKRSRRHGRH